jgi:hypothetical protein
VCTHRCVYTHVRIWVSLDLYRDIIVSHNWRQTLPFGSLNLWNCVVQWAKCLLDVTSVCESNGNIFPYHLKDDGQRITLAAMKLNAKSVDILQVWLKSDKITDALHADLRKLTTTLFTKFIMVSINGARQQWVAIDNNAYMPFSFDLYDVILRKVKPLVITFNIYNVHKYEFCCVDILWIFLRLVRQNTVFNLATTKHFDRLKSLHMTTYLTKSMYTQKSKFFKYI